MNDNNKILNTNKTVDAKFSDRLLENDLLLFLEMIY